MKNSGYYVNQIEPMSVDSLGYVVKRISKRAGINKTIHPHQLLHSYTTHPIDNGAPPQGLPQILAQFLSNK